MCKRPHTYLSGPLGNHHRKRGRVVYCAGMSLRSVRVPARLRGFESLRFRLTIVTIEPCKRNCRNLFRGPATTAGPYFLPQRVLAALSAISFRRAGDSLAARAFPRLAAAGFTDTGTSSISPVAILPTMLAS